MRMRLSAAFAVASVLLAMAAAAHAQSVPAEEELLGGPGAPITLRPYAPPPAQAAPKKPKPVIVQKTAAPAKPVVAQKAPKAIVAPKPVVALKPPPAAPKIVVAEKPEAAKPAAPAPKIAAAEPKSIPREPPVIRYQQQQAAPLAPQLEEAPTILAERDDPPAVAPADEDRAPARDEIVPVPDQQFAQVDRLIERAVRRGDIRLRTADALHDDLLDIADMQDELLNDGALRAADRELIDARLHQLRDRIDEAAQTGPGWR